MIETLDENRVLTLRSNHMAKDFLSKLSNIRGRRLFTDVSLVAEDTQEGEVLEAHRILLACCSPYFEAMFCGDFKDSNSKTVTIGGLSHSALKATLDFFYTGVLVINQENVGDLLKTADLLLLQQVRPKIV